MKTASELLFAILSAIALIYLVMILQFGSWRQPLAILVAVPFSLIGALLALFIMQQGVDISVGMGLVTLVGISVNNAIVLVDFSNREQKTGKSISEALLSAASVRLRPILLTSFTTIAALLPVALGSLGGSQIFKPFAITLIGGLIAGSIATLVLIPTILYRRIHA
jgi:multidrug efflux pump subunit AcrB